MIAHSPTRIKSPNAAARPQMSADPAVKSAAFPAALPRDPEPIRIRTLALLRWIAIAGQLAAVIVAHFMSIGFPVTTLRPLVAAALATWAVPSSLLSSTTITETGPG